MMNLELMIAKKTAMADILREVNTNLEYIRKQYATEYKPVGQEQAYKWEDHKKVPLWEDEDQTIPKLRDTWDYVEKLELTEEDKLHLEALDKVEELLMKLL